MKAPFRRNICLLGTISVSYTHLCEWRLTRSLPETGDKLPVYIINRNGEEAYLALIRQDGSFVAYHLEFAMDEGYCAWLDRPVLQLSLIHI